MVHRAVLRGVSAVEVMVVLATLHVLGVLAVYSVRRYLGYCGSSMAVAHVGAINRGAAAAYERRQALCPSVESVPASGPPEAPYLPRRGEGLDFQTGDREHGWRCLRFSVDGR